MGMSINCVTKVPTGFRALQSCAATLGDPDLRSTTPETTTGAGSTVRSLREASSVRENEEVYVNEKLARHYSKEAGVQHRLQWNG